MEFVLILLSLNVFVIKAMKEMTAQRKSALITVLITENVFRKDQKEYASAVKAGWV